MKVNLNENLILTVVPSPSCVKTSRRRLCRSKGGRPRRCRIGQRYAKIIDIKMQQLNNNCKKENGFAIRNGMIYVRRGCNIGFTVKYVPRGELKKNKKNILLKYYTDTTVIDYYH